MSKIIRERKINEKLYHKGVKQFLEEGLERNPYGISAVAKLAFAPEIGPDVSDRINRAARWFELDYPNMPGRFLDGEPDFVTHILIRAVYQWGYKLPEETMNLIHKFFTEQEMESKYKSENHMFLFHESRYLYGLKFPNAYFKQYQLTAAEAVEIDRKFLQEFIRFRAQRGWAEFDSYGYGPEVFRVLLNLYDFGEPEMSKFAEMSANVMLMDMIMDCSVEEGYYGGAHGRIYESATTDFREVGFYRIYQYYFGDRDDCGMYLEPMVSGFLPADYVYDVLNGRPDTWTNRECKHLHSITCPTPHKQVPQVPGSINKQTYVTPDYIIGGVTWQDDYPVDSEAAWYAHHQQHEWELSILPNPELRIFSHHPGSFGTEGKEHGYWTGDLGCCCVQTFSDKNIAMATYDIPDTEEHFIHARVPFKHMEAEIDGKFVWMKAERVYAMLWFSEGVKEGREDLLDVEVRSYGQKHGVVCTVVPQAEYDSMDDFKAMVKANAPALDKATMTLTYGNLKMNRNERFMDDEKVVFPYDTYDSPCVYSKHGSGIVETARVVLDFDGWGTVTYK